MAYAIKHGTDPNASPERSETACGGRSIPLPVPACFEENGDARHIAIDGKTMRASKDGEGKAEHGH